MRILIVNFGVGGFAGDSGQMLLIAKGLQEIEHKVTIVVTDGDPYSFDKEKSKYYSIIRKKLLDAKGKTVEIDGVTVFPIHCYTSKFGLYCPSASKIARKIIKNYDVVYVINWYYHLGMVFAKVAHECNIPFIISAYGSLQEEARRLKKNKNGLQINSIQKMLFLMLQVYTLLENQKQKNISN